MNWVIGLIIFVVGAFILQGLRKIPADPPHRAVLTVLGRRTNAIKKEGWCFFPLYPLTGYILVNMTKKNQDLTPREVRTAEDMAEIEVAVSLTWRPDSEKGEERESRLIEYLNSGAEAGVKTILEDIVEEAVREFAADPDRKPNTWEDAVKMKREFLAEIVAAILGKDPRQTPMAEFEEIAKDLRRGNGNLRLETLGIVLNRVNVTSIRPKGELAKAAELEAIEKRERKAEVVEVETDLIKARQLVRAAKDSGESLTFQQAYQITMEWKTTREGHGFSLPGVAPAVIELARAILGGRR